MVDPALNLNSTGANRTILNLNQPVLQNSKFCRAAVRLGQPTCRNLREGRQPTRLERVQEWLKTADLALANTMMLSSFVEEYGNLS